MRFEPKDINRQNNKGGWVKYFPEVQPLDLGIGVESILERFRAVEDREDDTTYMSSNSDVGRLDHMVMGVVKHIYSRVKRWNLQYLRDNLKGSH